MTVQKKFQPSAYLSINHNTFLQSRLQSCDWSEYLNFCCTVLRSYRMWRKISRCTKLKSLYECIVSDSRCQFYSWMPWLGRANSSTWCKVQSQSLCAMPLRQWPHQLYPPRSNQELSKTKVRRREDSMIKDKISKTGGFHQIFMSFLENMNFTYLISSIRL